MAKPELNGDLDLSIEDSLNLPDTSLSPDDTPDTKPSTPASDTNDSTLGNNISDTLPDFIFTDLNKPADDEKDGDDEKNDTKQLPSNLDDMFGDDKPSDDNPSDKPPIGNDGKPNPEINDDANEDNLATLYYNNLVKSGVYNLPEGYEFDGTFEGLKRAQQVSDQTKENAIKLAIWNNMPEELKPVVEYGLSGGTNINDFVKKINSTNLPQFDASTTEGQEEILRHYYNSKGIASIVTETAINKFDEQGSLETEAKKILKALSDERQSIIDSELQSAKAAQQEKLQNEKLYMEKAKTAIVANKQWNKTTMQSIYRTMFAKDEEGITVAERKLEYIKSNPEAYAQVVNFINHFDINKGTFNLEKYIGANKSVKADVLSTWEKELNNSSAVKAKRSKDASIKPRKMDWSLGSFDVN